MLEGHSASRYKRHFMLAHIANGSHSHLHRVSEKKPSTHIIDYKLRNSCLILIIFDPKTPHII